MKNSRLILGFVLSFVLMAVPCMADDVPFDIDLVVKKAYTIGTSPVAINWGTLTVDPGGDVATLDATNVAAAASGGTAVFSATGATASDGVTPGEIDITTTVNGISFQVDFPASVTLSGLLGNTATMTNFNSNNALVTTALGTAGTVYLYVGGDIDTTGLAADTYSGSVTVTLTGL